MPYPYQSRVSTKKHRLTRSEDIKRVRQSGRSYAHPYLVLVILARCDGVETRFGINAGRSLGNAVQRNRGKRLIREALSPIISSILPGWDVVILARRPIIRYKSQEVQQALLLLLKHAGIFSG